MRRYHQETKIIRRNHRNAVRANGRYAKPPGYYRKTDAFDCGKSRCWCCHSDKWSHGRHAGTLQARVADVMEREQLRPDGTEEMTDDEFDWNFERPWDRDFFG